MWLCPAFLLAACGWAVAETWDARSSFSDFESENFNVTAALLAQGVNVSAIPPLATLQERSDESTCSNACGALDFLYGPSRVLTANTTAYNNATAWYWSAQQEETRPQCVFKPAVNTDVSVLILLSRFTGCPFAVKSGGHAAFSGASNIQGGITVWLQDINAITLSPDKSIASIGPGNTWVQVYSALQSDGLAVVGGRVSSIGVGGLTTGGGISFYSNLYGWACDNVESYEVVTASGVIITASATEFSDLYWSLRGGGNNFGIVTKFNLYTIPSTEMTGGTRVFTEDQFPNVINAFVNVVNNASVDGNAQQYVAFLNQGINLASAELTYAKNVTNPAIFEQYRSIPAIQDTIGPLTLVELCNSLQQSNPDGLREVYWPISVQLNEEFANWVLNYFYSVLPQVANISGAFPVLIYQGITVPMLRNMTKFGGNALGISSSPGPLHLMHISCWWDNASDDDAIYRFVGSFWTQVIAQAQSLNIYNEYIYMNYGSQYQDVIAGYGATNKAKLQRIASSYDPTGVFQTLQPGYFKLTHAPVANPF